MTSPSSTLQSTLTQLHQWVGRISLLPSHLSTSHSLVSVGSGEVVATVLPRLTAILEQLKEMGVEHTRRVCKRVLQETKDRSEVRTHACANNIHVHIDVFRVDRLSYRGNLLYPPSLFQALSSKRYDLEGFAEYARQLRECQAFRAREGSSINYVLKVHSTLGRQGVEVPAQDKVGTYSMLVEKHKCSRMECSLLCLFCCLRPSVRSFIHCGVILRVVWWRLRILYRLRLQ